LLRSKAAQKGVI